MRLIEENREILGEKKVDCLLEKKGKKSPNLEESPSILIGARRKIYFSRIIYSFLL